jgi:hypothetical protein
MPGVQKECLVSISLTLCPYISNFLIPILSVLYGSQRQYKQPHSICAFERPTVTCSDDDSHNLLGSMTILLPTAKNLNQGFLCSSLYTEYIFFFISCKFTIYSTNWAISKYVIRKHLCGAIIQWWFSYVYCTLYIHVVRASTLLPLSGLLSQRAIAVLVCV